MKSGDNEADHDYLKRLPPEQYRGQAYVHWSMTIDERKKGWLVPIFYYKFREVVTHTMFRYGLTCPIYCCMPDHLHLLWIGILDASDQRNAVKYFRKQLNPILEKLEARFQKQPYDHVLREEDRSERCLGSRGGVHRTQPGAGGPLVRPDCYQEYPLTPVVLFTGYPELRPWQLDYWDRFLADVRVSAAARTSCRSLKGNDIAGIRRNSGEFRYPSRSGSRQTSGLIDA